MTTNPDKTTEQIDQRLELPVAEEDEFDEITPEEWAKMEAAYQDYLTGHDPGEPLAKVRQELLGDV